MAINSTRIHQAKNGTWTLTIWISGIKKVSTGYATRDEAETARQLLIKQYS